MFGTIPSEITLTDTGGWCASEVQDDPVAEAICCAAGGAAERWIADDALADLSDGDWEQFCAAGKLADVPVSAAQIIDRASVLVLQNEDVVLAIANELERKAKLTSLDLAKLSHRADSPLKRFRHLFPVGLVKQLSRPEVPTTSRASMSDSYSRMPVQAKSIVANIVPQFSIRLVEDN